MPQLLKNIKGQSLTVEYGMVFALVVAIIMAMTTYFKRAVQAQFASARNYVQQEINGVFNDPALEVIGNFRVQYEPYYTVSAVERTFDGTIVERESGGFGAGSFYEKEYQGYQTVSKMVSNQLSAEHAD